MLPTTTLPLPGASQFSVFFEGEGRLFPLPRSLHSNNNNHCCYLSSIVLWNSRYYGMG